MNPHLQRALVLLQQGRPELAEGELRQALAAEPDSFLAHALLADCLCDLEKLDEATDEAKRAIVLAPDQARGHAVLARALLERNRPSEARPAIGEAIRLDPYEPGFFSTWACIEYNVRDWPAALRAAEEGLKIDPEHVGCNNLRAMALVQLGRKAEAGATIGATLALDPENAFSHANQGWALLHQGDARKAQEHFAEALRLEPGLDYARRGLLEAMKARNPIYSVMLRYFLWMNGFSQGKQWMIMFGLLFGQMALRTLADQNEALRPFVLPIIVAYVVFALMTWLAVPLFNLLLMLNRFGRHALSRTQKIEAGAVGTLVGLALLSLAAWGALSFVNDLLESLAKLAAIFFGLLTMPVSGIFKVPRGWPRQAMLAYAGLMAAAGLIAVPLAFVNENVAFTLIGLFVWGCVLSWLPINFLLGVRVRR